MFTVTPQFTEVNSSYSHMRGQGICRWFQHRSKCSFKATVLPINPNIYSDHWEIVSIYYFVNLLVYATQVADIFTLTTAVQGVDSHRWGLYCRPYYIS